MIRAIEGYNKLKSTIKNSNLDRVNRNLDKVTKILIKYYDYEDYSRSYTYQKGIEAIERAIKLGDIDVVRYLINEDFFWIGNMISEDEDVKPEFTLVMLAVIYDKVDIFKFFWNLEDDKRKGFTFHKTDSRNNNLFHLAVYNDSFNFLKYAKSLFFLRQGLQERNLNGKTPIDLLVNNLRFKDYESGLEEG